MLSNRNTLQWKPLETNEPIRVWTRLFLVLILSVVCDLLADPGIANAQEYVPNQIVVELVPGASIEDVNQRWGTTTIDSFEDGSVHLLNAEGLGDLILLAEQMSTDPDVVEAEPNYLEDTPEGIGFMLVVAIGGDQTDYEDQGLTGRIGLPDAHQITQGLGVTIAVLDTGIDPNHSLFQGRIAAGGYDFVDDDAEPWEVSNEIDDDDDGLTDEGYGHGTMVAGLVLLVAPESRILPLRVLNDEGRSDIYRIARAVRYAREQGATVMNLSFGSPGGSSTLQTEMGYAEDSGIVLVSGAGNENREHPAYFPGESSKVIMITALDSLDVKAPFADWNDEVFVSAPGDGVRSAYPGDDWGLASGCSFATPLVSGMAALVQSMRPNFTSGEVQDHIETSVDPIYEIPGNEPFLDKLGSGRINVGLAAQSLVAASTPKITVVPSVKAFPNPTRGAVLFQLGRADGMGVASEIRIVDATGRRVRTLHATPITRWDGRDERGRQVPSGVYLYRLPTDVLSQKLHVVR